MKGKSLFVVATLDLSKLDFKDVGKAQGWLSV